MIQSPGDRVMEEGAEGEGVEERGLVFRMG
jgi:hypothetical protein